MRKRWLFLLCLPTFGQNAIRGFPPAAVAAERELELRAKLLPDATKIRAYHERLAAKPHHAGSPGSKAVADYILSQLKSWGLDANIEQYEALLPYPTTRLLEMTAPVKFKASLKEPAVAEDKESGDPTQLPTYNAYSASGDVTGPLVYVNYGVPEDYEYLRAQGVDVRGKIVIARYGKSWRGVKPKVAQEHGALACLIYSDPRDDGYFQGDAYPRGPMRPENGAQRGSVVDMSLYPGDPLSPGWVSEPGSRRLTRDQATSLLKIPVMPISYADAKPLLEHLGGQLAPEDWRGALPITYHIGPGPSNVHFKIDFDWSNRPLHNVIATIPGTSNADEWILMGNHHDAWVNGASDPLSGATALMETARALAELGKQGWKPKRTIKIAFWDGEEFGLIGSTEWVEKHADELKAHAAVYINSDSSGTGAYSASGSPSLEKFFKEVMRDVTLPGGATTVLDSFNGNKKPDDAHLGPLGSGSDYVGFFAHLGIASLNIGFEANASGVYHSIYDSLDWYRKFSDGNGAFGKAEAQVSLVALLRLAESPTLPLEFTELSSAVLRYVEEIRREAPSVDLKEIETQARALGQSASTLESKRPSNDVLRRAEQSLTLDGGLPGRDWYRHQISAPGLYTGYGAKTLPGVREAVEAKRYDEASAQAKRVAQAIGALVRLIQ